MVAFFFVLDLFCCWVVGGFCVVFCLVFCGVFVWVWGFFWVFFAYSRPTQN